MLFVFISLANVRQYFQFAKNLKEKYTFSFQIIIENGGMNDSLQRLRLSFVRFLYQQIKTRSRKIIPKIEYPA